MRHRHVSQSVQPKSIRRILCKYSKRMEDEEAEEAEEGKGEENEHDNVLSQLRLINVLIAK